MKKNINTDWRIIIVLMTGLMLFLFYRMIPPLPVSDIMFWVRWTWLGSGALLGIYTEWNDKEKYLPSSLLTIFGCIALSPMGWTIVLYFKIKSGKIKFIK